ncbi:hypothetical protein MKW92_039929 [Papaver armeniacum]|nr:hypothetical protein MKW92_039929 [Papaver armeniacum]
MVNLPWDILSDILVRLPAKSIARFRCVNKAWCNLLKNSKFLKTQYKHAVELNRFNLMFHNHNGIYTFSYDPSSSTCESSGHIRYPVKPFGKGINVLGICNGLVLLRHIYNLGSPVLILWNPSTNECKKLPYPTTRWSLMVIEEYGICYDQQIEDLNVVCIAYELFDNWCEVQVYTLRSNSWRRLEDIPDNMVFYNSREPDMCCSPVHGAFHWKALTRHMEGFREHIIRFDFEKEEFGQISLPDKVNDDHHLCVLGGSLWFLNKCGCSLEFWELKENGEKKSWNHSFSIDLDKFDFVEDLIPLQILENGKILFGVHNSTCLHFVLYDLKHETTRTLKVHDDLVTSSFPTSVYVESLISLDTGTYLGKFQWGEVDEDVSEEKEDEKVEVEDEEDGGGTGAAVAGTSYDDGDEKENTLRTK